MSKKNKNPGKLNGLLLIISFITGVLTGFAMTYLHQEAAYESARGRLLMPLFMGLLFAGFLLITCLAVYTISKLGLTYRADVITGKKYTNRILLYLLAGCLAIGITMLGAEYLYETNFRLDSQKPSANTYIFLIDDSSSMEVSDPRNQRYSVVETILGEKQDSTRFAVYSFGSGVKQLVPMQTVGDGFPSIPVSSAGLTHMKEGLETVLEDCLQERWADHGAISMILITDGAPSDFKSFAQIRSILDQYNALGITLGIVGATGADTDLMNAMAEYTGGTFTSINDINMMEDAVLLVANAMRPTRDLLSENTTGTPEWLYALIRILAITIAGTLIALTAALCYGNNTVFNYMFWANTIKAVFAGILMEAAFRIGLVDGTLLRLAAWVLLGTIITRRGSVEDTDTNPYSNLNFFDDDLTARSLRK